jgi:hypothetical protein
VKGSTVALIALGVAGAGAGLYFLVIRPRQIAAAGGAPLTLFGTPATTGAMASAPGALAPNQNKLQSAAGSVGGVLNKVNAFGTGVAISALGSYIGVPSSVTKPVASVATAIDRFATNTTINAIQHPVDTVKAVASVPVKAVSAVGHFLGSIF